MSGKSWLPKRESIYSAVIGGLMILAILLIVSYVDSASRDCRAKGRELAVSLPLHCGKRIPHTHPRILEYFPHGDTFPRDTFPPYGPEPGDTSGLFRWVTPKGVR